MMPTRYPKSIVLTGPPAVGKTTLAAALKDQFGYVNINVSMLRSMYLKPDWSNQSFEDYLIACRVAEAAFSHHQSAGVPCVLDDMGDEQAVGFVSQLRGNPFLSARLVSLVAEDEPSLLCKRLYERKAYTEQCFADAEEALRRNAAICKRALVVEEKRIDICKVSFVDLVQQVALNIGGHHYAGRD